MKRTIIIKGTRFQTNCGLSALHRKALPKNLVFTRPHALIKQKTLSHKGNIQTVKFWVNVHKRVR